MAMVEVLSRGCGPVPALSTAVVVADGLAATVAHAIAGAEQVSFRREERGPETPARVVAFDVVADLALLEMTDAPGRPVPIGQLSPGDDAILIGYGGEGGPHQRPVEVTRRIRARIEDFTGQAKVQRPSFEFRGEVESGDSGGPLLDATGAIGAIVFASSDERSDMGFAVRASELERVMTSVGVVADGLPLERVLASTLPTASVGPCPS